MQDECDRKKHSRFEIQAKRKTSSLLGIKTWLSSPQRKRIKKEAYTYLCQTS
jgi:hypothetical protein